MSPAVKAFIGRLEEAQGRPYFEASLRLVGHDWIYDCRYKAWFEIGSWTGNKGEEFPTHIHVYSVIPSVSLTRKPDLKAAPDIILRLFENIAKAVVDECFPDAFPLCFTLGQRKDNLGEARLSRRKGDIADKVNAIREAHEEFLRKLLGHQR